MTRTKRRFNKSEVLAIEVALRSLGSTVETVSNVLRAHESVGIPGACGACPIARYLHRVTGIVVLLDAHRVVPPGAGSSVVNKGPQPVDDIRARGWVPVPDGPCQFVSRFDLGKYPDLVDRS